MNNLCHVVNDPIEGVLVDVLQGLATVKFLQVTELHLHLLLFLQDENNNQVFYQSLRYFRAFVPKLRIGL